MKNNGVLFHVKKFAFAAATATTTFFAIKRLFCRFLFCRGNMPFRGMMHHYGWYMESPLTKKGMPNLMCPFGYHIFGIVFVFISVFLTAWLFAWLYNKLTQK